MTLVGWIITSLSESEMVSSISKPPWCGFSVLISVWDRSQMRTFLEPANGLILYLGLSLRPLPWILRLRRLLEPGPRSDNNNFKRCLGHYKVAVITSSVVKITVVVADIIFKEAVITSSVAKSTFVVAEITFKVFVITSSLDKITFVVAEITLKVAVITSSLDKITFVVAEITFNVAVVTSSLLKNGSRE